MHCESGNQLWPRDHFPISWSNFFDLLNSKSILRNHPHLIMSLCEVWWLQVRRKMSGTFSYIRVLRCTDFFIPKLVTKRLPLSLGKSVCGVWWAQLRREITKDSETCLCMNRQTTWFLVYPVMFLGGSTDNWRDKILIFYPLKYMLQISYYKISLQHS